ncbi:DinB family protein [Pedobacter sp. PWIIR3]
MNHRKISDTSQFLAELNEMVELHLQQAISIYQNTSASKLNKQADQGGWSVAQCLAHLNSYGEFYLPQLEIALANPSSKPVPLVKRGWLGDYFIKMMDPNRKAARYQAMKKHLPQTGISAHQIVANFIEQQEQLLKLLRRAGTSDLNNVRIPTSISGMLRLRLGDALAFLIVHNERHIQQANRNLKIQE